MRRLLLLCMLIVAWFPASTWAAGPISCCSVSYWAYLACVANDWQGYPAAYQCWTFAASNGTWGWYATTRAGGDGGFTGPVVNPGSLPAGFQNGGLISGEELMAAMYNSPVDYCGSCGDVPPAPESPDATYGDGPGTEAFGP